MIISSNIKKYREAQHLTQEELAKQMNISRQSISKWERGDTLPSIENLIYLSELLELSLDELILDQDKIPLPFHYGKFSSNKVFIWSMSVPILLVILSLFSLGESGYSLFYLLSAILIMFMIQGIGFLDLRRMYDYFTIKKTGIEYFKKTNYCPIIIREILAMFNKRPTEFIPYNEILEMEIYFNNQGFQGHGTTIAYRPRQYFYNREWFELIIHTQSGVKIVVNLDKAFYPLSDERKYFCGMFRLFESRGISIKDPYNILHSIENEYDLINEAYQMKEVNSKEVVAK